MSELRILANNYPFDPATVFSALSKDPAFPASNLALYTRAKVYRSFGYFLITATNNKINFKDTSGGAELTATIPEGAYVTEDLATMIGTKISQVSVRTYTCTYSTATKRWTIAGTVFLSLLWLTGTNTATSIGATLGFDVTTDHTGALTYTGARIACHTEEAMQIDLGATQEIDSCLLYTSPSPRD